MTVSTLPNRVTYIGNGSTTQFAVPFKVLDEDHLVVERRLLSTNEIDYTYIGTDYSYSGIGADAGTLTLDGAALSSLYQLEIERIVPYTQELDIVNAGGFYPESLEAQLDLTTMQIQQIASQSDDIETRALMVPVGDEAPAYADFAATFKGDPGGNVMAIGAFASISSLTIPVGTDLIRTSEHGVGTGIGGAFYIADATVDVDYAIAHPTMTAVSANSRGWRIAEPVIDITQAGIVPGNDADLAEPNSDAVDALLAYLIATDPLPDNNGTGARKLTAPDGHFRFARNWELKCAIWLEGQSNSQRHGYATQFEFDEAGFVANRVNTLNGALESPATTGADGFRLENLYCTSRAAAGTGFHGLHAVCRGDVIRCIFSNFPGDGIRVETPTAFGGVATNANSTRILYCGFDGNGGNGIYLMGGDANCVVTIGCDFSFNGQYGLNDDAFLSNSHTGHHAESNGLGLIFAGHKMGAVGSVCYYPVTAWASGVAIAISATGTFRTNASKVYVLLEAGGGNTANGPTHTTAPAAGGVEEADGYRWAYIGTILTRWYHVAPGQATAASTTTPGTNPAVWVPMDLRGASAGVPLWVTGMTWVEGGSYRGLSQAGATVWTACYSEDNQPLAQVQAPAIWIGGQSAPSSWSTCVQIYSDENGTMKNPKGFSASSRRIDGGIQYALFGSDLAAGLALKIGHETRHPNAFDVGQDADTYFLLNGQTTGYIFFTGPQTAFTGGRSTVQIGKTFVPELFIGTPGGAAADSRSVTVASAAPASGYHAAGEMVFNNAPAAGGSMGWMCVTAGDPGTWKAMPNLAA